MTSYLKIWGPFGKAYESPGTDAMRIEWGFIGLRQDHDVRSVMLAFRYREADFTSWVQDPLWVRHVGRAGPVTDPFAWVGEFSSNPIPGKIVDVLIGLLPKDDHAEVIKIKIRKRGI